MQNLVILSRLEQENLVRAIEAGLDVQVLRQLFIWCQGALRGLLPHGIMVCIHFGEDEQVLHVECLNSLPMDAVALARLCDPTKGLAVQLARYCRELNKLSCRIDAGPGEEPGAAEASEPPSSPSANGHTSALSTLRHELVLQQLSNALVHGTDRLHGGATFFALFEMSSAPTVRHEFFLSLMLPYLHMAFLRVLANRIATSPSAGPMLALSPRELEVLSYVIMGKTNLEIGMILELSPLTVKNHLQKIYRKLKVSNRVQALARSNELKLFAPKLAASRPSPLRLA